MVLEDGEAGGWCPQSFGDHCGKLCWQLVAMDGRGSLDYNIKTELDSGPAHDKQTEFNSLEGIISNQAISKKLVNPVSEHFVYLTIAIKNIVILSIHRPRSYSGIVFQFKSYHPTKSD